MKDISMFRSKVWSISESLLQYFLSIQAGYPNYAVNRNAFVGFEEAINQRLRQDLIEEDFEDDHIFFFLIRQLAKYIEAFGHVDIQASNWLLQQKGITQNVLSKQFDSEIHLAAIDDIVQKEATFPYWLEDPEYQGYLLQAVPFIEKNLNTIEAIEDQIISFHIFDKYEAILLSGEWEVRQKIKFMHLIVQKGIHQALLQIQKIKQVEKNPLGWMVGGFNQRIDDKIDQATASNPEEAIRILRSAFRLKPKAVQACMLYYNLAMHYEDLERWEEAIDAYSKMNEVAPPNGVGLFYRAKILHQLGRDAEAKRDLEQALSLPSLHIYVLNEKQKKEAEELLIELSSKE